MAYYTQNFTYYAWSNAQNQAYYAQYYAFNIMIMLSEMLDSSILLFY